MELADMLDSKSDALRRGGSNPFGSTNATSLVVCRRTWRDGRVWLITLVLKTSRA